MVKRYPDWPRRLSDFIAANKDTKFEWGKNDCIIFGARLVETLTGENYYSGYQYDTEEGARKIIEENGGVIPLIKKYMGQGHSDILKAGRGDIVVMKLPELTIGFIDDSGRRVIALGPKGIVRLPLKTIWRVWGY